MHSICGTLVIDAPAGAMAKIIAANTDTPTRIPHATITADRIAFLIVA